MSDETIHHRIPVLRAERGMSRRELAEAVGVLPDEDIDERQIALRDRTYLVAYRILATTVAWLLLAAWIVADASATRNVSSSVAD